MDEFIKSLDMLPHNYEAYQKVMAHYDSGRNKAAIVHATGTGKSYIIAAVAHQFTVKDIVVRVQPLFDNRENVLTVD